MAEKAREVVAEIITVAAMTIAMIEVAVANNLKKIAKTSVLIKIITTARTTRSHAILLAKRKPALLSVIRVINKQWKDC